MSAVSEWRLQLLNTPALHRPGGPSLPLARVDAALLAVLTIDGATSRKEMAELLWPDAGAGARPNLRQRLTRWRTRAGLVLDGAGLALTLPDELSHDLQDLPRRLRADASAGVGRLLGQYEYADKPRLARWVAQSREQLRTDRLAVLADRAEGHEREQRLADALLWAERLAFDEPLLEHAHRRVMRLHYLRGDRGAALAAYDRLRASLRGELGIVPGQETLELARLIEAGAPPDALRPTAFTVSRAVTVSRPPRLVGRQAQWQVMEDAWAADRIVVVSGEPGIGKSRLAQEFADAAGIGLRVAVRQGDASLPYAVLAKLLRAALGARPAPLEAWVRTELARVLPELGEPGPGVMMPLRLAQAALQVLAPAGTLWLDDLQFADDATLDALPTLLAPPRKCLLSMRTEPVPAALSHWLAARDGDAVEHVLLGPLDAADVETFVASLDLPPFNAQRWAAPLLRHTGGHPLFMLETLRELLKHGTALSADGPLPVPVKVGQLIGSRLQALPPEALQLARTAALLGPDFDLTLAAAVLRREVLELTDAWRTLEQAGVMHGAGFAHDLMLEATRASVPAAVAAVLHGAIARRLAARDDLSGRVAVHWEEAAEWPSAAASHVLAARAAYRASRRHEEAQHWERAADCFDRAGDRVGAFDARIERIRTLLTIAPVEQVRPLVARVRLDARTDHQRARALIATLELESLAGNPVAVEAEGRLALRLAEGLADDRLIGGAARWLAVALTNAGTFDEAEVLMAQARAAALRTGDVRLELDVLSHHGYILDRLGRNDEALQMTEHAARIATELGDLTEAITLTNNLAAMFGRLAQLTKACAFAAEARDLGLRLGHVEGVHVAVVRLHIGWFDVHLGHYRQGLRELEAAAAASDDAGSPEAGATCRNHAAWSWLLLGQSARALSIVSVLPADLPARVRARRLMLRERAVRFAGLAASDWPSLLPQEPIDWSVQTAIDIEVARRQPPDKAARRCAEIARSCEEQQQWSIWMNARLARVDALRTVDLEQAAVEARALLADLERLTPTDAYWPEFGWICFDALRRAGQRAESHAALLGARGWIAQSLAHVPDEFRESFLRRNRVNAAIAAALPSMGAPALR